MARNISRRRRQLRAAKRELRRWRKLKQSPGAAVPFSFGSASEPARDYEAFSREAYTKNVIAFRCVSLISRGVAALRWYATQGQNDEIIESPKAPISRLLAAPNIDESWGMLLEAWSAFLLLNGNGYLKRVTPKADDSKRDPRALRLDVLRSDRVEVAPENGTGLVTGYTYTVGNHTVTYPRNPKTGASNVLHVHSFNPLSDYYGLSPVEPSAFGVDQHNAAGEWNYRLLKNGARPSAVLEHDPGDGAGELSEEQRARIKQELKQRHRGPAHAGSVLLLESYLKWKQMSFTPVDMDCERMKLSAGRDVATAFGVPPMLVGITGDATFANYKEARLALWEDTILPLATYLMDALNRWLMPGFGDNVKLAIDSDQIPAIAAKRAEMWAMVNAAGFLGLNEKREAAGYDDWTGDDDVLLVPLGVTPLDMTPPEEPEPDPPPEAVELELDPEKASVLGYGR